MNAGDATHRVNPDQQWRVRSQKQARRRESNTLESVEKKPLFGILHVTF